MTPEKHRIKELDRVVLTENFADQGLKAGDIGTVVDVYADGEGFEVEFCDLTGETIDVVTVTGSQVRPIQHGELPHARRLAG
jgi:ATP-dependent exoDNAse (exonuclease V) alpha subunit